MSSQYRLRVSTRRSLGVLAAAGMFAACSSSSTGPGFNPEPGTVLIDASSQTAFTYFSLEQGKVVTVTNPQSDNSWDLAFRRFTIRTNSGVAGAKGVTAFNLAAASPPSTDEVIARTKENTLDAFKAIDESQIPASSQFQSEALAEDFNSWFQADQTGTTLVANPRTVWKVKLATGGYAALRVKAITVGGNQLNNVVLTSFTPEWRLQAQGGTLGAPQEATFAIGGSDVYINLNTGQAVQPNGCNWDLRAPNGPTGTIQVTLNATCGAGTFPFDASEVFADITTAATAPEYGPFLSVVSGPIPNSFFDPRAPFLYNLVPNPNGPPLLFPTFNTYLVKVGDKVYKLQVIDYYDQNFASGHPTIRYARIK